MLKRHVFVDRVNYKLYPNMYTILVGRPGIGKGAAVNPAISILREANAANILSDRLTMEYILERMAKGFTGPQVSPTGGISIGTDSTACIFSPELSIFIGASQATLPVLTDLWDSREDDFHYGTRGKGEIVVSKPAVCLLAGSTAEWLMDSIPASAIGGGFTRRVNFVYARDRGTPIAFPPPRVVNCPDRDELVNDLRHISGLRGQFRFHKDVIAPFTQFYDDCMPDEFADAATAGYVSSRWAQATKLAMVFSAARTDSLEIELDDWAKAVDLVEAVGKDVKAVFRGVGASDMVQAADKVLRFLERRGYATKREILSVTWQDVTSMELDSVLMTLRDGGLIIEDIRGSAPAVYKPAPIPKAKGATP